MMIPEPHETWPKTIQREKKETAGQDTGLSSGKGKSPRKEKSSTSASSRSKSKEGEEAQEGELKPVVDVDVIKSSKEPKYVSIGFGELCLFHLPSSKQLKSAAPDVVISLLSNKENIKAPEEYCKNMNVQWVLLDFWYSFYRILDHAECNKIVDAVQEVVNALKQNKKVLVHCSAGIHRTGIFAYWILRILGRRPEDIPAGLHLLRPVTAAQVGTLRLQAAESRFPLIERAIKL